ncbi:MAG: phosphotransferase [Pseudomonadales bacterium]|nr:phosphotransferase [Pseudomonadales bacterium]
MNIEIKSRYNKDLLSKAISRYGISPDRVSLLGDFDSFVYEFDRAGSRGILRISHSSKRSASLVMGELDWVRHLVEGGASVSAVMSSDSGQLLEELPDNHGEAFLVAAFTKAEGVSPKPGEWTRDITEQYGQLLGRIHRLSRNYSPRNQQWLRPDWDDPIMLDVEETLSGVDSGVLEEFRQLLCKLETLPKDEVNYGLIHQDAHGENLKIDDAGQIMLYDVFDCAYSWFVNDIAIVLFYAAMWEEDPASFTEEFMRHFLEGYRRESELNESWLTEIPLFLKLREIDLYAVILREFGTNWHVDQWNAGYMKGRKKRIEAGTPYIDYDFSTLAD